VANNNWGLGSIDITDPTNPIPRDSCFTPGYARGVFVSGDYAYVADETKGLAVIDISNPLSMSLVENYTVPGSAEQIYVSGDYAYLASGSGGLHIFNISDPTNVIHVTTYTTSEWIRDVYISGNYAFLAASNTGLEIINITDPRTPTYVSSHSAGAGIGIFISGDYAYIAGFGSGLIVVNITDPSNPSSAGSYNTPFYAGRVYVSGDYAFIADGYLGTLGGDLLVVEVRRNRARQFETPCVAQSTTVFTGLTSSSLVNVTLTSSSSVPAGTTITYYLSADNGVHCEQVSSGVKHTFIYAGNQLKWKAVLSTTDSKVSPSISSLSISYKTLLNAPSLVNPSDGLITNNNSPTFTWSSIADTNYYLIQIDDTSDFNSPIVNETIPSTSTDYNSSSLPDGTYYWRVSAVDSEDDWGVFSSIRTLIIDTTPPTSPSLVSPHNNTITDNNTPNFNWTSVIDAANYTLQLDTSTSFSSFDLRTIPGIVSTSYLLSTPLSDGTWYWRVCAYDDANNQGPYSTPFSLIIDSQLPLIDHPPDILYEVGEIGVTITWNPSDLYPSSYIITRDSGHMDDGPWNGSAISIDVSGLQAGTYEYICRVIDKAGNSMQDIVIVTVQPTTTTPPPVVPFGDFAILFTFLGIISLIILEKKKINK